MESVIEKIKQARSDANKRQADITSAETVIDGCQVKIRFSPISDSGVVDSIKAMLISAYLDSAYTAVVGG